MGAFRLFLLLLSVAPRALSASFCDAETSSRCVPWIDDSSVPGYYVNVMVNSVPLEYVAVDTGSTGFLVSAKFLGYNDDTALKKCCQPAFEYLSSSRRYYEGYWLPSNLTFSSTSSSQIHSKIPILAVTERGTCKSFQDGNCDKADTVHMPTGTKYMGIGFGRWSSEQPNATASTNPLLNIEFPSNSNLRSGYMISNQGLILGISDQDLDNGSWATTQLSRNPDAGDTGRPEWTGTPICVQVEDSECFPGTALFDTGVPQSYLGVPSSATENFKIPKGNLTNTYILRDSTSVTVRVGQPSAYVFTYSFTTGDFNNMPNITPTYVQLSKMHDNGAFINTGRAFYNRFSILFEEDTGTLGIKANQIMANVDSETRAKLADPNLEL